MVSCGKSDVDFLSPQPEFVDALIEIPKEYRGEFRIDGDTHIVTRNTVDGISISEDSVVVKERGSYFYVNTINKNGFYNLAIVRRVNFLNHESISLYIPQFNCRVDNLDDASDHLKLFKFVGSPLDNLNDTVNPALVLEDVTVNQLSILTNSSKKYKVVRIK